MKLLERTPERLVFSLSGREKTFLERLLSFYPLQRDPRPSLSREHPGMYADGESLLHEALREQHLELGGWLRIHLSDGEAIRRTTQGWRLILASADVERLLQVLNELRVSAWTRLGCPEEIADESLADAPGDVPMFAIMTLAGQFQMALIHALDFGNDVAPGPRPLPDPEPGSGAGGAGEP